MSAAIAESLSAEALPDKPTRRGSKNTHSQEEMQRKMDILMSNPKLWQEFKTYLAESGSMSRLGTQQALHEFLETNQEIAAEDAAQVQQQTKQANGVGRKIMGAVSSFTSELGAEEASPRAPSSPPKQSPAWRSSLASGSASTSSTARRTPMSNAYSGATSMGMGLLRRAGQVASSSLGGLDKEAEVSIEEKTCKLNLNDSRQGMMGTWFQGSTRSLKDEIDGIKGEEEIESDEELSLSGLGIDEDTSKLNGSGSGFVEAVTGWLENSASKLRAEIDTDDIQQEQEKKSKEATED
jgi:hypothetical protein